MSIRYGKFKIAGVFIEVFVKVNVDTHYLWRVVDHEFMVLVINNLCFCASAMKVICNADRNQPLVK